MGGSSKSNGGHTPYEAPESGRSRQSMRIIEALSEGRVKGLVNGMQSIYFDDTPLQNPDGSFNFSNITWDGRFGGLIQDSLSGFNASENEVAVSLEVRRFTALTRTVTDENVTRLRFHLGVNSLFEQTEQGDTKGSRVEFNVHIGSQVHTVVIEGKYSSQYLKEFEVGDLPAVPFQIKVERITPDSQSQRLQNKTLWASYTEIIDATYTYPHTALMGIEFDSEFFSQLPKRTYEIRGIECQIPSNYNPYNRTYTGDYWDGSFKTDWTDNPVWVLYDLLTNKRYGLGNRLDGFKINRYQFYAAAQYCDQLVPDGFGGKEPRFTCNLWLTEQRKAYDVIMDLCSSFRALPVWSGAEFSLMMDRPSDPVWTYNNTNVIDGRFEYAYSANKERHNSVQVEYYDKLNSYQKAIEVMQDDDDIAKHGLKPLRKVAFGCTSRGQAQRTAQWIYWTEKLEKEMVTFSVGREGLACIPSDIIQVADNYFVGTDIGGRILNVNGRNVTLDRPIDTQTLSLSGLVLSFVDKVGKQQNLRIQQAKDDKVLLSDEPKNLLENQPFVLAGERVQSKLYRCISIQENEEKGQYTISAIQHEPQKEAIVDNGAEFERTPTTLLKSAELLDVDVQLLADGSIKIATQTSNGSGVLRYDVKIFKDGKLYKILLDLADPNVAFDDLPDGDYTAVIVLKQNGRIVSEKSQSFKINRPPVPVDVAVFGGLSDVMISWKQPDDFTQTEIWASERDDIQSAKRIAKVLANTYSHSLGARQGRYYWVRHSRGQNVGVFSQQGGLFAETGADIDKELELLNEKLKEPLSREILETALPARQLEMVKTVSRLENLTTYQGAKLIFSQHDGKLYRWDGKTYTAEVKTVDLVGQVPAVKLENIPSSKITGTLGINQIPAVPTSKLSGQLSDAQIQSISAGKLTGTIDLSKIPAVPTSKLSGQVSAAQISANSIGANHIATNAVSAEKIQANAVNADKIATNAITAVKIAAGAVNTDKLAANAVSAAKIQANAIGANHIAANAITAGKIAANAVVANSLATNAVTAVKIATNAVTADKVAANAITAGKIAANAVTAGTIQAGAINANHIASAAISTDKLAVGLGGNLLYNPIFANNADGWITSNGTFTGANILRQTVGRGTADFTFKDAMQNEFLHKTTFQANYTTLKTGEWADSVRVVMPVARGQWYMFSAYFKCYRCAGRILVEEYSSDGKSYVKNIGVGEYNGTINGRDSTGSFQHGIAWAKRHFVKFKAPETGWIAIIFRISEWLGNNPDVYIARPMLEECTANTTAPSPWQNAGVTAIHGGSIKTNTITAQQIAANTITGNEIVAGTIATKHLAANSVTATQLAANSVTANKMNIGTLSAISSNIGTVTAGTIKGTTITGNTISGGTISGTTVSGSTISGGTVKGSVIEGGTIRAAYLDGASGSFSGTLTVNQLIGSNIIEVVTLNVNSSYENRGSSNDRQRWTIYRRTINISAANIDRFFYILGSTTALEIPANQSKTVNFYEETTGASNNGVIATFRGNFVIAMLIAKTTNKTIS